MARKSRTYVRDASGRFASTPGGGKGAKRGRTELVRARRSVRQAKRKLAGFDPADQSNKSALSRRAQRGAVTKAQKRLAAVKKTAVIKGARVGGTIAKKRRQRPAPAPAPAPTPAKAAAPKRVRAARPASTVAKPKGLKPGALAERRRAKAGVAQANGRDRKGQGQRAEARAIANYNRSIRAQPGSKKEAGRAAVSQATATRAVEFLRGVKRIGPQRGMTSRVLPKGFVPQARPGVPAPDTKPQPAPKSSGGGKRKKAASRSKAPANGASGLPQETRSALRDVVSRRVQAEQALTGHIQKLGGITKQQAQVVFDYYSKRKFIKFQGIDNVGVKSGNLLERDTIRQALQLAQEPAKPKQSRGGKAAKPASAPAKPAAPVAQRGRVRTRSKPDLSQAAFERRARATEKRARAAEQVVAGIDRYNPANRRLVNRANSLRSAADSYASYARRGKTNPDVSAAGFFQARGRYSTAPKLTRSEKAAATRRANADKRFQEDRRRMERDRRR